MGIQHGELLATTWVELLLWIVSSLVNRILRDRSIVPSLVPRPSLFLLFESVLIPRLPSLFVLWVGFSFVMEVTSVPLPCEHNSKNKEMGEAWNEAMSSQPFV